MDHDREVLQLGPTGAPLPDGLFRPRGCRIVVAHVNNPVYPVGPLQRPDPASCSTRRRTFDNPRNISSSRLPAARPTHRQPAEGVGAVTRPVVLEACP